MTLRPSLLLLAAFLCTPALAERADRDKPMHLEANRISIDDAKKTQTLEGDVVITKGTLVLRAERILISEDQYGFQKASAFAANGRKASFRQKREGREDFIEGEAERIDYDSYKEVAELFKRAYIQSGADEVKGDYIWYDAISEKFLATNGDKSESNTAGGRVRATIQPRNKAGSAPPPPASEPLPLRDARSLSETPAKPATAP